jgi:hypothetical protein
VSPDESVSGDSSQYKFAAFRKSSEKNKTCKLN